MLLSSGSMIYGTVDGAEAARKWARKSLVQDAREFAFTAIDRNHLDVGRWMG
jgi:hypothetical protein